MTKEWRVLQDSLFDSGRHVINVKHKEVKSETFSEESEEGKNGESGSTALSTSKKADSDSADLLDRLGSKSLSTYDRLLVIRQDMDLKGLWGWKGTFVYW
ncbi:hypothetical protein PM082_010142 [Marasmius tenuissimus]|nr:hypothetical protein PM082_010142 [Marasmius tenuissimus]